ncbi:restriction endonuclease subunit S [Psychrobacter submarinus]|uniref:restriction endonuclease subunit S n=1 Tax=Psychrobacter submarinus TaxID=154108 RepID=UPI00191AA94E|nr:restriction endonuclease subunit S [Psychrobacter submarinus]
MKKGWELKKLGNVMEIARGGSPRPIKKYITESEDGLNWIKISDATASSKYIYETKQKISKDGLHKTRLVEEGDFLLSNSMSFGRPYIMKTRGCIHDGWLVLKEKEDNLLNKDYLYYLLGSPYIFKEFDRLAAGSTVRNLNIALVSSVQIPIPPIEEQQQIVAILDDAFAAIEQAQANIEKNIENAKELFQSKLNDIFSQKGEGWRREVVKDVLILKSGKTVSKDIEKDIGEVIYTKVGDMNLAGNEVDIVSSSRYVNFKDINESQIIPKGSVIFPKRGGAIATNKKRRIVKPTI